MPPYDKQRPHMHITTCLVLRTHGRQNSKPIVASASQDESYTKEVPSNLFKSKPIGLCKFPVATSILMFQCLYSSLGLERPSVDFLLYFL
jgi:hypothetical protein